MVPPLHFSLASFSSSWTSSLLFLHFTETGHSHSPERFAAANLGGTASSTDARQPPGPQEPFRLLPGAQVLEVAETETSSTRTKWAAGGGARPRASDLPPKVGWTPWGLSSRLAWKKSINTLLK